MKKLKLVLLIVLGIVFVVNLFFMIIGGLREFDKVSLSFYKNEIFLEEDERIHGYELVIMEVQVQTVHLQDFLIFYRKLLVDGWEPCRGEKDLRPNKVMKFIPDPLSEIGGKLE